MKQITTSLIAAIVAALVATSCVTRHVKSVPDYGSFPDIQFLSPAEAKPIRWAEKGQLHGSRMPEEDWRVIMGLLSRIPGLSESDRQLVNIVTFDDPPVAVKVQLGYGCTMVTFVKTGTATWKVAGIYDVIGD